MATTFVPADNAYLNSPFYFRYLEVFVSSMILVWVRFMQITTQCFYPASTNGPFKKLTSKSYILYKT